MNRWGYKNSSVTEKSLKELVTALNSKRLVKFVLNLKE